MAYQAITDSNLDPDAPILSADVLALKYNPIAFKQNDATSPYYQDNTGDNAIFTASGTWTKPSWVSASHLVRVQLWGGGGGGNNGGAGGGGGGGAYVEKIFKMSELGAEETVTVGAGGATGNPSLTGGTSSFGTLLYAYGGGGVVDTGSQNSNGGGGGGSKGDGGAGTSQSGTNLGKGGLGYSSKTQAALATDGVFDGGGGGGDYGTTNGGGSSTYGGGGGGQQGSVNGNGGNSLWGGGGGCGTGGGAVAGTSLHGGSGGAALTAGTAPGGGGGYGAAGARGECRVTVFIG